MYNLIKFLVVVIALLGILYFFSLKKKSSTLQSKVNKEKLKNILKKNMLQVLKVE